MKKTKEQRHTYIMYKARELAKSGNHRDYLSIEWALRDEGYSEARDLLDRDFVRKDLKRLCDKAQERKTQNS